MYEGSLISKKNLYKSALYNCFILSEFSIKIVNALKKKILILG